MAASLAPVPGRAEPVPSLPIAAPMASPQWREQVAATVAWTAREKVTEAELQLHPPELGPVRVHLKISDGAVEVQFAAAQPSTRDALQDTLPRLREMLVEQGMTLVQAQVGDRDRASQPWPGQANPAQRHDPRQTDTEPEVRDVVVSLKRAGLLDEYA